jgi:hypothetical protein
MNGTVANFRVNDPSSHGMYLYLHGARHGDHLLRVRDPSVFAIRGMYAGPQQCADVIHRIIAVDFIMILDSVVRQSNLMIMLCRRFARRHVAEHHNPSSWAPST